MRCAGASTREPTRTTKGELLLGPVWPRLESGAEYGLGLLDPLNRRATTIATENSFEDERDLISIRDAETLQESAASHGLESEEAAGWGSHLKSSVA